MNDIIQVSGLPATLNAGNVESVADNSVYKYKAEDMVALSGGGRRTFESWCTEVFATATECGSKYRTKVVEGKARYYLYTEEALKAFQQWRMKNQASQGRSSQAVKDAACNDAEIMEEYRDNMKIGRMEIIPTSNNETTGWTRKQDVANSFGVTERTLQNIVDQLNMETDIHIKKGGYHNLEVFYDDFLVDAIGKQLMKNQANQGRASQAVKDATNNAISLGNLTLAAMADEKAWNEFVALGNAYMESKRAEQALIAENKQALDYIHKTDNLLYNLYIGANDMKAKIGSRIPFKCPPMKKLAVYMGVLGENDGVIDDTFVYYRAYDDNNCKTQRQQLVYNAKKLDEFVDAAVRYNKENKQ